MKAILVIDMPSCCHTCRLEHYGLCMGTLERKTIVNDSTMPNYCPLKPAPSEYVMSRGDSIDDCAWFYGYNKCVREVTGDDSH